MAHDSEHKTSAELQRELEQQRNRVENTIDEIQQKLSPGQLVDEMLAYTKGGGGEFLSSLQRNVTANPLPVALLGVSLAWLMAKPAPAAGSSDAQWDNSINRNRGYTGDVDDFDYGFDDYDYDDVDYPVATISGSSLTRVSQTGEDHNRFAEFLDESGKKFRARTDSLGRRAGHFTDETGNRFKGFANSAGERVVHIRDEAGNLLDEASGWASHTWKMARERMHDARDALNSGRRRAGHAGSNMMGQMGGLNETIINQFRDQPLVGGALAFALGAALGTALPHTEQEDAVMGKAADKLKAKATEQAASLYEEGKEKVADLHDKVAGKTGEIYQQAKDGITQTSSSQT